MVSAAQLDPCEFLVNADSRVYPLCFATTAEAWFSCLQRQLDWHTETITIYGKQCVVPRLTAFYGDPGIRYRYSGTVHIAQAWHPLLADIRDRLLHLLDLSFNSVLANFYRDGNDYMGWHSDDEPELHSNPVIASVSLGAERPFYLRHKENSYDPYHISLPSGALLVMGHSTQRTWQHSLPRRLRIVGPRINLTFRNIDQPVAGA
jgi:alkylated DNA repair dioxygenase AlkB